MKNWEVVLTMGLVMTVASTAQVLGEEPNYSRAPNTPDGYKRARWQQNVSDFQEMLGAIRFVPTEETQKFRIFSVRSDEDELVGNPDGYSLGEMRKLVGPKLSSNDPQFGPIGFFIRECQGEPISLPLVVGFHPLRTDLEHVDWERRALQRKFVDFVNHSFVEATLARFSSNLWGRRN